MPQDRVYYHEEQTFRQIWMWAILSICVGAAWYFFIETVAFGSISDTIDIIIVSFVWTISGVLLPVILVMTRLVTQVRSDGIYVRYVPFHLKERRYGWEEISGIEAVEYRPILDYGGWGIRYGPKGKAFNVSGKEGVRLSFEDGRRDLLIGSRHSLEFEGSIKAARRGRRIR